MKEINKTEDRFPMLFEQLISEIAVNKDQFVIPNIERLLNEISALLRLSKGVTSVYMSPVDEQLGRGETLISYDTGKGGRPVHTVRIESRLMSIATMTIYMADDEPDLTEKEFERADLTMRTVLRFISRNRLQDIAVQLAFYDDQDFRNSRSFFRFLAWHGKPGGFDGMVAMNYNLRHFSLVNESYGRDAGDKVLMNHYKHIEELSGGKGIVSRLGGDSFVCIFPQDKLDELISYLSHADVPYDDEGHTTPITCCAGIFIIPDGYMVAEPNMIMGKIMYACRIAQTGGQDSILFYNESLIEGREHAMRIRQQFPEALENKEFKAFFQPKVDTETGEIRGAEALCRWFKDGRIVPPLEFIPILEQTNDICKLDFYVLDLVCGYVRKWLDEGRDVVRTSVNFSRKHITNERLLDDILKIVDSHNVPHELIEIELTETTTDVEFKALQRIVVGLQENRICTSVDDFGMGYSSLNLIRVIPWNVLKVDRSFLPEDKEDADITRNIMFRNVVTMAKEMGLTTLAEGVETTLSSVSSKRTNATSHRASSSTSRCLWMNLKSVWK